MFQKVEELEEHTTAIATLNDDDNCNGHSTIRFNLLIYIRPILRKVSSSMQQTAPSRTQDTELSLFNWFLRIRHFSIEKNARYDEYCGVRGG